MVAVLEHTTVTLALVQLQAATDQHGRPLQVVPLPMPNPVDADNAPLPASYANFYLANGAVLVPTYDCPQDQTALAVLRDLLPRRRVIGIPCPPWSGASALFIRRLQRASVPPLIAPARCRQEIFAFDAARASVGRRRRARRGGFSPPLTPCKPV
jgi:hypothetical protein